MKVCLISCMILLYRKPHRSTEIIYDQLRKVDRGRLSGGVSAETGVRSNRTYPLWSFCPVKTHALDHYMYCNVQRIIFPAILGYPQNCTLSKLPIFKYTHFYSHFSKLLIYKTAGLPG